RFRAVPSRHPRRVGHVGRRLHGRLGRRRRHPQVVRRRRRRGGCRSHRGHQPRRRVRVGARCRSPLTAGHTAHPFPTPTPRIGGPVADTIVEVENLGATPVTLRFGGGVYPLTPD